MKKAVFFDLDGTLTDPGEGITNSAAYAIRRFGLDVATREELYSFIGPPLDRSFMDFCGFDQENAVLAVKYYREYYAAHGIFENTLFDGVSELLCALKENGKTVVLATSKPEHYARIILEHFGIDKYFDFICGGSMDEKRNKKEEIIEYALDTSGIAPEDAVMVGDRLYDIEGAVNVKKGATSPYKLGVNKLDAYTLEINYREGADPKALLKNLASVATSPVRQDKYENSDGFWTKLSDTMVFNGPFKIVELDYEDQSSAAAFKLERNVGYHQDYEAKDYDDEVNPYKVYSFYNADGNEIKCTYAQLTSKTVFFMGDASLADRSANKSAAEYADTFSTYSYVFNTENPLFAVKEVRQALSMVIDRNQIVNAITFGTAASGFVPAIIEDSVTEESFRNGNDLVATSAKLSDAQALIDSVANQIKSYDKTIVLTVNDDVQSVKIAELVEAAWESLGFVVEVEALSSMVNYVTENELEVYDSAIQYIVKSKALGTASKYDASFNPVKKARYDQKSKTFYSNFDVIAVDWQFYTNDAFVGLASLASSFNKGERAGLGGWTNAEYNAHIAQALKATTKEDRMASLHAAEKLLIEEMPVAPIVFNQNFAFISKDLSGVKLDGFGNFVFTDAKLKKYESYLSDTRFDN